MNTPIWQAGVNRPRRAGHSPFVEPLNAPGLDLVALSNRKSLQLFLKAL